MEHFGTCRRQGVTGCPTGIISVVALVAYANHVMASPPPVSVLPVQIYAVLFSGVFVFLFILFWRHNRSTYPRRYAQWNRSFICERCGATLEAPDELFRGLAATVRAKLGFCIDPHHFAMLGRCADCS